MINSRKIEDLHPEVAIRAIAFIAAVEDRLKIDLLVTCTYRDDEAQAALYAQGRTAPGKIVTNAKPGQSNHQKRIALDVVPLRAGKPVWNTKGADGVLWNAIGEIGEEHGLSWAGRWKRFKEFPHFEYLGQL